MKYCQNLEILLNCNQFFLYKYRISCKPSILNIELAEIDMDS